MITGAGLEHTIPQPPAPAGSPLRPPEGDALLATKLYVSPLRPGPVSRPRLLARLQQGLRGRLFLLTGPAGSGKTTLLGEWLAPGEHCSTFERFFAVPFPVAATAAAGHGHAAGRPWRFLLLAIVLHGAVNCSSVLLQAGLASLAGLEVWVALLATATTVLAFWLRRRGAAAAVAAS